MKAVVILVVIAIQMDMAYRSRASPLKDETQKLEGIIDRMLGRNDQNIEDREVNPDQLDLKSEGDEEKTPEERQAGGPSFDSTYIGCFKDDASRHFGNIKSYGAGTTLAACRQHCMGYRYVGLQATDWCTCGNTLYKEGYPLVNDAECNLPCKGETSRMCGSHWRDSIYFV